jgi:hypothetical protein
MVTGKVFEQSLLGHSAADSALMSFQTLEKCKISS